MRESEEIRVDELVKALRLEAWFRDHVPGFEDGDLRWSRLSGGSSNTMLRVSGVEREAVLRMPIRPPRADSLNALEREGRLLRALNGTDVPHACLLAHCRDKSVAGLPFIVMEFVDGWMNFGDEIDAPPAFAKPRRERRKLAFAMIDALATLRTVDLERASLSDFGKPEGFLERQVPRYLKLIESYKDTENHPGRVIPGMDYVVEWLRSNIPPMSAVTLIHGDLGFPNILFEREPPARVAAIVDWEVATIGDPLLDLGRALFSFPGRTIGDGKSRFGDLSDYPTREELAQYYADITGADVSNIEYFYVLSMFKLAALIEWNYARAVNGRDSTGLAAKIADHVLDMMATAERIARAA